ncbi:hypothetical protein Bbelb_325010 [Branchiostoma belcheri]|nr:hypothetical protein Bbelb_325010 [Branchiostoma belcheri]
MGVPQVISNSVTVSPSAGRDLQGVRKNMNNMSNNTAFSAPRAGIGCSSPASQRTRRRRQPSVMCRAGTKPERLVLIDGLPRSRLLSQDGTARQEESPGLEIAGEGKPSNSHRRQAVYMQLRGH